MLLNPYTELPPFTHACTCACLPPVSCSCNIALVQQQLFPCIHHSATSQSPSLVLPMVYQACQSIVLLLQLQSANAEDVNRNPVVRSLGGIFLVWLTFGFSVWYAFYFSVLAAVAGTLSILRGKSLSNLLCVLPAVNLLYAVNWWHSLCKLKRKTVITYTASCLTSFHSDALCPSSCEGVQCLLVLPRIPLLFTTLFRHLVVSSLGH